MKKLFSLVSALVCRSSRRALGGGVAVAGFLTLGSALLTAAPVKWSVNVALPSFDSLIYFNPVTGETSLAGGAYPFQIYHFTDGGINHTVINSVFGFSANRVVIGFGGEAQNLALGASVNAAVSFNDLGYIATAFEGDPTVISNFQEGETGYIGLTFVDNAQSYYGWASIVRSAGSPLVTLTGFGYNSTPGEAAIVGASPIPEPAAASLLAAMGALAIAGLRRGRARC